MLRAYDIPGIEERRRLTEHRMQELVNMTKSTAPSKAAVLSMKTVRDLILNSDIVNFDYYLARVLRALGARDVSTLDHATTSTIEDAWNYFPHRALGGKCPADLMPEDREDRLEDQLRTSAD